MSPAGSRDARTPSEYEFEELSPEHLAAAIAIEESEYGTIRGGHTTGVQLHRGIGCFRYHSFITGAARPSKRREGGVMARLCFLGPAIASRSPGLSLLPQA